VAAGVPQEPHTIVGRFPEDLLITERIEHAGKWMAIERYVPTALREEEGKPQIDLRQRHIRALGVAAVECVRQLEQAGLDARNFEFTQIRRM
jgi:hypothetical protein